MTTLENHLSQLKENIVGMMQLVEGQLTKSQQAFAKQDVALAKEIHQIESRVDAHDLSIDKDCENIIALYNPVASDLRFVLASFKIVAHLERIGDHADKIARYVRKKQIKHKYDKELLNSVRFNEMFNTAIEMVNMAIQAFVDEDTSMARQVFVQDATLNEIYQASTQQIDRYTSDATPHLDRLLYLFSIINKLERVGDLAKNIAEETIFYTDAKTLRHQKFKKLPEL
ncbi:MAG: phosphate signaling complex protein PhoU [Saprospiraceae bacterium]|nr:phosphate signaling complex protein PhoU [Saprospiraceae bacterium]